MKKILLIHGYGIGINSIFQKTKLDNFSFEEAFEHRERKCLEFYNWCVHKESLSFFEASNPKIQIRIYKSEQGYVNNRNNQRSLAECINENRFTDIIAHSMGANFVLQTINSFDTESVKNIVVLHGDCRRNLSEIDNKIKTQINIINYYNPLDYTLWSSFFINRKPRSGLFGFKDKNYKNIKLKNSLYFPTFKSIDIHTDILKNKIFWSNLLNNKIE